MEQPVPTVALQAVPRDATGQPVMIENETIRLRVPGVELFIGSGGSSGKGVLFITTKYVSRVEFSHFQRNVTWLNDGDATKSLTVDFRSIVIHAIAKDTSTFPHPCIYCQLDGDNEDAIRELRFVPTPDISLDGIYAVMNACAALNPDSDEDEDGDDDNFFWTGSEGAANPATTAQLARLASVFHPPSENGVEEGEDNEEDDPDHPMES